MSFKVTYTPGNQEVVTNPGETILEATLRAGYTIPYGCRNGGCGSCKGKVLHGEIDHGPAQPGALTEEEKAQGMALFCCATPQSDLLVEAREVRSGSEIQVKTLPARVQTLKRLGHDVMLVELKLPAAERLQFLAGQYVDVLLRDGKKRSYSLANAPHDDEVLQFHIRHIPGGLFTEPLFNTMQEKAIWRIRGPLGSFFLREESDKPIIFMAGGTGFAPIKSIIEHALYTGVTREMVLYWGCRTLADLYMPELPAQWSRQHPNLTFIPVLSQPLAADNWPGRTGYVTEAIAQDFPDLSGYQIYASGSPTMVEAGQALFSAQGLPASEYFADAFTFAND